jgi:heavy metal translocating P-type ATPase
VLPKKDIKDWVNFMIIVELVLASSATYAGLQFYRQRTKKKSTLRDVLITASNPGIDSEPSFLAALDARYQTFVQTRIDPLLEGKSRTAQMKLLASDVQLKVTDNLNTTSTALNRYLAGSLLLMSINVLSVWLFPPLLFATGAATIYLSLYVFAEAYRSLRTQRQVTTELLIALYVIGTWAAGYLILEPLFAFLYFLGAKVVFLMETRSRQGVSDLFGLKPNFAWRVTDGLEIKTPIEALEAGDIIVANPGEPIPVDGVISAGMALVDQRHLTGEAQPVEKSSGDVVLAATLLLTGRIYIRVEKAGNETTAAQISAVLEQTANYETPFVTRGQEIANQSALPNLMLSLLAWPVRGFTGAVAILSAGPSFNLKTCSLLSMLNYLQIAAQDAILIKDGRALDKLSQVDTIVFDKTGTLTIDQPHVAHIHCIDPALDETTVLTYAAAAEYRQSHPIAKAILTAAEEQQLNLPMIDEASYKVGFGIEVMLDQQWIHVGSERFMQQNGITIPEKIQVRQAMCHAQGHTLVLVACNRTLVGALELHATLRPDLHATMADLRQRGLALVIISGDQEEPTRQLANQIGIEHFFANTLPENKAALIAQLQAKGHVVCFIGDGINDAIALKQADVSISLRGATTIATDTAQVVLMDHNLAKLGDLFELASQFNRTIQHIFWATLAPGVLLVGGVFFLHFGIIAAEVLLQLGFFNGIAAAMLPLLRNKRTQEPQAEPALSETTISNH